MSSKVFTNGLFFWVRSHTSFGSTTSLFTNGLFFWVRSHTSFGSTTSLAASEKAWFVNWTKHSWTHSAVSSKKDQCQLFSFVDILDFTCLNRKVHACRQKFSDFFSQYARKQEMRKKLSCGLCGADSQGLGGVLKSSFCAEAARKRSWTFQ